MIDLAPFLEANAKYASGFPGGLKTAPLRRLAVLTCMDSRIEPFALLGIGLGDAHVVRNAGGRAADALRSLAISQEVLGTRHILVVHHTECGLLGSTNEGLRARFAARGVDAANMDFLPFADLEASVREDVAILRESPLIAPESQIDGLVFDVATGRLHLVS